MEDATVEDRLYGTFEKHDAFAAAQGKFLGLCNKALTNDEETEADVLMRKLAMIVCSCPYATKMCCSYTNLAKRIPRTSLFA